MCNAYVATNVEDTLVHYGFAIKGLTVSDRADSPTCYEVSFSEFADMLKVGPVYVWDAY